MAYIRRFGFFLHLRSTPTAHIVHLRRGTIAHEGVGITFSFRALTAAISEVPTAENELPLVFHSRTVDFQDVAVAATITYRFSDPSLAARRIDFAIDTSSGRWIADPLAQVASRITELAQQYALESIATMKLIDLLATGLPVIRTAMTDGLALDKRLAETSILVIGVRVVSIQPQPDLAAALETPLRERVQQDADKATFERRAVAVERERAIAENELQSKIELSKREELLVGQEGANALRRSTEAAASEKVQSESRAQSLRVIGTAEADAEKARLAAYTGVDSAVLLALAARSLAENLPEIGTVNLSPDVLSQALSHIAGSQKV